VDHLAQETKEYTLWTSDKSEATIRVYPIIGPIEWIIHSMLPDIYGGVFVAAIVRRELLKLVKSL
jgi:hypothetical protein